MTLTPWPSPTGWVRLEQVDGDCTLCDNHFQPTDLQGRAAAEEAARLEAAEAAEVAAAAERAEAAQLQAGGYTPHGHGDHGYADADAGGADSDYALALVRHPLETTH